MEQKAIKFAKYFFNKYPHLKAGFDARVRYDIIKYFIPEIDGQNILDVGCGGGIFGKILEKNGGEVVYLSPDVNDLRYISGNKVVGNGIGLPIKDGAFDYVVSSDVFEHVSETERSILIREMMRVAQKKVIFTFSQVHTRNPKRLGILLFEWGYKLFKVPYPSWYQEHNNLIIPEIEEIVQAINNYSYTMKPYQGCFGLFLLGIEGVSSYYLGILAQKNLFFKYITFIWNRFFIWTTYAALRLIDIKPFYSFGICIDLRCKK